MTNQCQHKKAEYLGMDGDMWCTACGAVQKHWNIWANPNRFWRSPEAAKIEGAGLAPPMPPIDWQARLEGLENFVRKIEGQWENRFSRHVKHHDTLLNGERENSFVAMHGHDVRIHQLSDRVQKLQDIMNGKGNVDTRVEQLESMFAHLDKIHFGVRNRVDKLYETFQNVIAACDSVTRKNDDGE